jgi:hypothetical protein
MMMSRIASAATIAAFPGIFFVKHKIIDVPLIFLFGNYKWRLLILNWITLICLNLFSLLKHTFLLKLNLVYLKL